MENRQQNTGKLIYTHVFDHHKPPKGLFVYRSQSQVGFYNVVLHLSVDDEKTWENLSLVGVNEILFKEKAPKLVDLKEARPSCPFGDCSRQMTHKDLIRTDTVLYLCRFCTRPLKRNRD